jgi:lysophospholipase L1-like esterase
MRLLLAATLIMSMFPASAPVNYVALGDSYASGLGAGGESGSCSRSTSSYPELWKSSHSVTSFADPTCGGATIADVLNNQVSSVRADTTLVTITAGGNDADFAGTMTSCHTGSDASCQSKIDSSERVMRDELPARIGKLVSAVRGKSSQAKIIMLGYPKLFAEPFCSYSLSETKRTSLNKAADLLADTLSKAAASNNVTFVDGRKWFAGHGICAQSEWVNRLNILATSRSYHPNASGQRLGYLGGLNSVTG